MAGTSTFRIDTNRPGTLALRGELDSATFPRLLAAFEQAVSGPRDAELHLDLSGLSFIDSAGMRAIIQIEQGARERGLALVVTAPAAPLTELLSLAGLAERLTLIGHRGERPGYRRFLERVEVAFEPRTSAPSRARAELRQAAQGVLGPHELEAAVLMTSELVTNAVLHAHGPGAHHVVLRITVYEDGIRCEITDPGPGFEPASLVGRTPQSGGRGLLLVDALASRWGTERLSRGQERFLVWFELDAVAEEPAVAASSSA